MFGNNLGTYIQKKKRAKYLIRKYLALFLYPDPGSNRDGFPHWCLRPARLPIPPSGLFVSRLRLQRYALFFNLQNFYLFFYLFMGFFLEKCSEVPFGSRFKRLSKGEKMDYGMAMILPNIVSPCW